MLRVCGVRVTWFGLRVAGNEVRGYEVRIMGCGVWLRVARYGMRVAHYPIRGDYYLLGLISSLGAKL